MNEHIYQCTRGHFVCKRCWPKVQVNNIHVMNIGIWYNLLIFQRTHCPKCREKMLGRAFDFEIFLQNILEK